jgi:hypothetical protein
MTNGEFYTWVAVLSKTSTAWLQEGVVMQLNRGKHQHPIRDEAVKSFLSEMRRDLAEIENLLNQQIEKTDVDR